MKSFTVKRCLVFILAVTLATTACAGELPDPTRPPQPTAMAQVGKAKKTPVTQWRLTMTRLSGKENIAMLNGKLVREGDYVQNARVVDIGPASVQLEADGGSFQVAVSKGIVKTPSRTGRQWGK